MMTDIANTSIEDDSETSCCSDALMFWGCYRQNKRALRGRPNYAVTSIEVTMR